MGAELLSLGGVQGPVPFLHSLESVGTVTQVTAVAMRLCKDSHRAQSAGGLLGYSELFSFFQCCFILCFHSGGVLASAHLHQQLEGGSGWGRQLRKIPVTSVRSVYGLYAGSLKLRGQSSTQSFISDFDF